MFWIVVCGLRPIVYNPRDKSGRSAAWLARYLGVVEVVGSNPAGPIKNKPLSSQRAQGFFYWCSEKFFETQRHRDSEGEGTEKEGTELEGTERGDRAGGDRGWTGRGLRGGDF